MPIKNILKETEDKMEKVLESLRGEFSEVRTGRAHPGLVEGLRVNYFGTFTAFKDLATVSIPDPRTIMIQPWDVAVIPEVEKAIQDSHLGLMPSSDGKVVRLTIPHLSTERREELKKIVKDMVEKGKVSLRTVRRDANDRLKKFLVDKTVSEDNHRRGSDDVQKLTDRYIIEMERLFEEKSDQLME